MSDLLSKAILIATRAHEGQTRKGSGLPYIVHCNEVVTILVQHGITDLITLAIGMCHDVPEDTKVTIDSIRTDLGDKVAEGVAALTKPKNLSKDDQRKWAFESIKNGPKTSRIVKMADRYSNIRDLESLSWSQNAKLDYAAEALTIAEIGRPDCPSLATTLATRAGEILGYTLGPVSPDGTGDVLMDGQF